MSVTYNYTGSNFTTVTGSFTKTENITGYIVLDSALAPASTIVDPRIDAFSFSDGVDTISSTNGGHIVSPTLTTNGSGQILNGTPVDVTLRLADSATIRNYVIDITNTGDSGFDSTQDGTSLTILSVGNAINFITGTWSLSTAAPAPTPTLAVTDTTTGQPVSASDTPYTGQVAGLQSQYINITADNLNITASTPNWFLHSGSGSDAITASSGTNVLDGGTGSNFLTGGTGTDTFFVDNRGSAADIWSTVNKFHVGDAATIWGVTSTDFKLAWVDGQGAAGYTGLTLHATATGKPTASLTLVGFTSTDLSNGRLSVSYGTSGSSAYMYVHANS